MEGVGSRLGRASSRYGPATVFTGPVRKWKKQWVHVSSSSSNVSYQNTSQSNGNGNNNASTLLLCRWTPISPTYTGDPDKPKEVSNNLPISNQIRSVLTFFFFLVIGKEGVTGSDSSELNHFRSTSLIASYL
uniref:Uncharacterized protein n=1 Tax=Davidia involucrata TaxID=16924 RepID=A0A5B6ZJ62_DAVIN